MPRATVPESGPYESKAVPGKAQRRAHARPVHKIRVCHDGRPYVAVPFTIPGVVQAVNYAPEWRADRDYWIAKIVAEVGRHDEDTHPDDGTPSGSSIRVNMRKVSVDLSSDVAIVGNDLRLHIAENHHQDAVNDAEDGRYETNDFNVHRLAEGERIYVRVSQVGSDRPGTGLVVTAVLVPIP